MGMLKRQARWDTGKSMPLCVRKGEKAGAGPRLEGRRRPREIKERKRMMGRNLGCGLGRLEGTTGLADMGDERTEKEKTGWITGW